MEAMGATGGSRGDDDRRGEGRAAWLEAVRDVTPLRRGPERMAPPAGPRVDRAEPRGPARFEWHREPDGYVEAWRLGSHPSVRQAVTREPIEVEARLDLHGMNRREAAEALRRFVRTQHARGRRTLLVIHGKGLHRADGRAELPAVCHRELAEGPLAPLVLSFASSPRRLGGLGALVVRLRS